MTNLYGAIVIVLMRSHLSVILIKFTYQMLVFSDGV